MLSLRGFFPRASAPRNGDPWRRERAARSWLRCRGAAGAGCAECDQQGNTRAFALFSRTLTPPPPPPFLPEVVILNKKPFGGICYWRVQKAVIWGEVYVENLAQNLPLRSKQFLFRMKHMGVMETHGCPVFIWHVFGYIWKQCFKRIVQRFLSESLRSSSPFPFPVLPMLSNGGAVHSLR